MHTLLNDIIQSELHHQQPSDKSFVFGRLPRSYCLILMVGRGLQRSRTVMKNQVGSDVNTPVANASYAV